MRSVAAGYGHSLAVREDDTLWAWGLNGRGQLGVGSTPNRSTPVRVLTRVVSTVTAGDFHSLAVREDGTLWAWGDNSFGELGDVTTERRISPVRTSLQLR